MYNIDVSAKKVIEMQDCCKAELLFNYRNNIKFKQQI